LKRSVGAAVDFDAARDSNDAFEVLPNGGVFAAASLTVSARSAADAFARARHVPALRAGLHVVMGEVRPRSSML
jgi:chitin disaccharide deacetylase